MALVVPAVRVKCVSIEIDGRLSESALPPDFRFADAGAWRCTIK
jgi:hypothetical protein